MYPAMRCAIASAARSEEHTSELQSRRDLVCRLLLEKKKNKQVGPAKATTTATLLPVVGKRHSLDLFGAYDDHLQCFCCDKVPDRQFALFGPDLGAALIGETPLDVEDLAL